MRCPTRLVLITSVLCSVPALLPAASWSGFLVDSKCYAAMERNVNPFASSPFVDRDRGEEIQYCSPNAKTMQFTFVRRDGLSFKLDDAGNQKAVELVRSAGKKSPIEVTVTGEESGHTVKVDTLSIGR